MRPTTARLALALAAAPLAPAAAQPAAPPAPGAAAATFGVLAGLSSATLGGGDVGAPGRRNGLAAGAAVTLPVGAGGFALRPELLYVQKGARQRQEFGADFVDARVELTYFELPVLLQYTVPTVGGLRPRLYAGPAVALRTACRVGIRARLEGEPVDGVASCDEADGLGIGDGSEPGGAPSPRRLDVGGVVGGALAFPFGVRTASVGVRYTHGFLRLSPDADVRNRAVLVYGGIDLPLTPRPR